MAETSISVLEHVRPVEYDATPGVYRVVGTDAETVTLLRVASADGRRKHTGELRTVDRDRLSAFESADNPDGNRSVGAATLGRLDGLGWQLRAFTGSLAERPLPSALAAAALLVGLAGDQFVAGPEWAFTVAVFTGSLGLAALGSNVV